MRNSLAKILIAVNKATGVSPNEITGKSKAGDVPTARFIAMYIARKELGLTFQSIADDLNKTHASVINACNEVDGRFKIGDRKTLDTYNKTMEKYERPTCNFCVAFQKVHISTELKIERLN